MKHPFWIANLSLFFLVLLALLFIYFSRRPVPMQEDIESTEFPQPIPDQKFHINIKKIYENDLFNTYIKEHPTPQEPAFDITFPEPPRPYTPTIPEPPAPQFIDPLDITLKGIIILGTDESKNRALIEDNKTKKESAYKISDVIEDAQLIRIFSNKIIFLRSNGQQEVLYLREKDAQLDPAYAAIEGWDNVVAKEQNDQYIIYLNEFAKRITNLGQFIDMLGLTTAYKKGKSIGCRAGIIEAKSLGASLGLQSGDIITEVNTIPTKHTADRIRIYETVMHAKPKDTITVQLNRHSTVLILHYTLQETAISKKQTSTKTTTVITTPITDAQFKQEHKKFEPTLAQIHKRDRELMRDNRLMQSP